MMDKLISAVKDLIIGTVLGVLIYALGIFQSYYIYFDFISAIMNVITPLFALFLELFFIVNKSKRMLSGLIRIIVMSVVMFLLTGFNYKIYTFVINHFDIYESPMVDNTSGLCSALYVLFVIIGAVLSMIIIRKREHKNLSCD